MFLDQHEAQFFFSFLQPKFIFLSKNSSLFPKLKNFLQKSRNFSLNWRIFSLNSRIFSLNSMFRKIQLRSLPKNGWKNKAAVGECAFYAGLTLRVTWWCTGVTTRPIWTAWPLKPLKTLDTRSILPANDFPSDAGGRWCSPGSHVRPALFRLLLFRRAGKFERRR